MKVTLNSNVAVVLCEYGWFAPVPAAVEVQISTNCSQGEYGGAIGNYPGVNGGSKVVDVNFCHPPDDDVAIRCVQPLSLCGPPFGRYFNLCQVFFAYQVASGAGVYYVFSDLSAANCWRLRN